jgi:hypothetical protein
VSLVPVSGIVLDRPRELFSFTFIIPTNQLKAQPLRLQ